MTRRDNALLSQEHKRMRAVNSLSLTDLPHLIRKSRLSHTCSFSMTIDQSSSHVGFIEMLIISRFHLLFYLKIITQWEI